MPLPTFATAEEVPEAFREIYEERDGKWLPKETEVPDVAGLRSALQSERAEKAEAAARAAAAEAALAEAKRTADAKEKGIPEAELQKIRDAEAEARKPIEQERDRLAADNRKLKLTDRVKALWLEHGGLAERQEDAMDQLAKRTDLGDKDGIVFKDKEGKITADTTESFFTKFRAEKPWLFAGTGAGGTGGGGGTGNPETIQAADPDYQAKRQADISSAF